MGNSINSCIKAVARTMASQHSIVAGLLIVFSSLTLAFNEHDGDYLRALDPALGISVQFGRWDGAINLVYDPDGAPALFSDSSDFLELLEEAVGEWELVSGIQFNITGIDSNANDDNGNLPDDMDGLVRIFWGSAGGAAGRAGPNADFYDSDKGYFPYMDGSVELNQNAAIWDSQAEIVEVLVHELGHLIGLGHSDSPDSVMYANPYNHLLHPRADDIQIARVLYGNGSLNIADISQPIEQWLYDPYPSAPASLLEFLFKPNQQLDMGAFISVASDDPVSVINSSTTDLGFVRFNFGGVGNFSNNTAIDIDATVVYVDPFGYVFGRTSTEIECGANTACGGGWVSVTTPDAIKTIPGEWTVYVVDESAQTTLLELGFTVDTEVFYNQAPFADVTVTGAGNTLVNVSIEVTDFDSSAIDVVWHPPGNLGDNDGDGFLDTEISDTVQNRETISRVINLLSAETHTFYVELNDNGSRYEGSVAGSSSAGDGFQSLMAITVDLPVSSDADVTVVATFLDGSTDTGGGSGEEGNTKDQIVEAIADINSLQLITTSDGTATSAQFGAGASSDEGASTGTEFANNDVITIAGSLNPQAADVGKAAEIYVVLFTETALTTLDVDGNFQAWNGGLKTIQPAYEVSALGTKESFQIFSGSVESGLYKVFLGYKLTSGGPLHFNAKAFRVNVD